MNFKVLILLPILFIIYGCSTKQHKSEYVNFQGFSCKEHHAYNEKITQWARKQFYSNFNSINQIDEAKKVLYALKKQRSHSLIKNYNYEYNAYYNNKRIGFKKGCYTHPYKSPYTIFKNGIQILNHYKTTKSNLNKEEIQNFNDFYDKNQYILDSN